jgi:hypothetical protein
VLVENANAVIALERWLGIFHEQSIQTWMLEHAHNLVISFNWFYTVGFFPVILPFAVIMFISYRRHYRYYRYYRSVLVVSILITWSIYAIYPLAPPHLIVGEWFIDTVASLGSDLYMFKDSLELYNAFSAMPSMHFGWTVLVGLIVFRTGHTALRVIGIAYPALMFIAVIVTGNHYVADPLIGGLVVYASLRIPRCLRGGSRSSCIRRDGSDGALGGTRTHDLFLRREALYPLSY